MKYTPYIRIAENAETAVLMIHGIVGTPAHFQPFLPLIPDAFSVYNILLDGHGKQVEDFSRTDMKKWKTQVQTQLDEILLTHTKVLIVAHSMGTLFAVRQAIRHPEKICALFLLNVPLTPFVRPTTAVNSVFLALGKTRNTLSAQELAADCGVMLSPKLWKYIGWIPRFWELLQECRAVRKLLPQLQTPALTFQSRHDELVSMGSCKYLKDHPYITNTVLENSGHFAYRDQDLSLLQSKLKEMIANI